METENTTLTRSTNTFPASGFSKQPAVASRRDLGGLWEPSKAFLTW